MPKWNHVVKFQHFWNDDEISIEEKGKLAAKSLDFLTKHFKADLELEEIIEDFKCTTGDGEPPEKTEFTPSEDFDARMYSLYEWADSNRVWIKTFA